MRFLRKRAVKIRIPKKTVLSRQIKLSVNHGLAGRETFPLDGKVNVIVVFRPALKRIVYEVGSSLRAAALD